MEGHAKYPFYVVLNQIYERGGDGIHIFFCLSGFIFFWLYSNKIRDQKIKATEFWILRFSRLWPLHIVTLLIVILLQQWYSYFQHAWLVCNDDITVYSFFMQLIFASCWGFKHTAGFNVPIWTVSIEILLYFAFFIFCSIGFKRWWSIVLVAIAGLAVNLTIPECKGGQYLGPCNAIASAFMMFFIGGLLFKLFTVLQYSSLAKNWDSIAVILGGLWILIFLGLPLQMTALFYSVALSKPQQIWMTADYQAVLQCYGLVFKLLFVPFTIICLALIQSSNKTLGKRLEFIGDISYSSYLLHFPLQIAFVCAAMALGFDTINDHSVFNSPWVWLCFFASLLICSYSSFRFFERPVQERIRKYFSAKKDRSKNCAETTLA